MLSASSPPLRVLYVLRHLKQMPTGFSVGAHRSSVEAARPSMKGWESLVEVSWHSLAREQTLVPRLACVDREGEAARPQSRLRQQAAVLRLRQAAAGGGGPADTDGHGGCRYPGGLARRDGEGARTEPRRRPSLLLRAGVGQGIDRYLPDRSGGSIPRPATRFGSTARDRGGSCR